MKTYDYIVELKRPNFKLFDWVSQLMLFLTVVALSYAFFNGYSGNFTAQVIKYIIGSTIAIIASIAWWIFCKNQASRQMIPYYRFALIVNAFAWFWLLGDIVIALLYMMAALIEKPLKIQPEIAFDADEIAFNSFPRKSYSWNVVKNVVLKDGLLTIDLQNNTLIQKEVNEAVSKTVEDEFNAFCKEQAIRIRE
jgi:hypothetical protein